MNVATMTEHEWKTIRIESALLDTIENHISKTRIFGAKKYFSRADFVKEACIQLLDKEQSKNKEVATR